MRQKLNTVVTFKLTQESLKTFKSMAGPWAGGGSDEPTHTLTHMTRCLAEDRSKRHLGERTLYKIVSE